MRGSGEERANQDGVGVPNAAVEFSMAPAASCSKFSYAVKGHGLVEGMFNEGMVG